MHIWECSTVTNNLVLFEQDIKGWFNDRIKNDENFKNPDELIEELYKYTVIEIQLKDCPEIKTALPRLTTITYDQGC